METTEMSGVQASLVGEASLVGVLRNRRAFYNYWSSALRRSVGG